MKLARQSEFPPRIVRVALPLPLPQTFDYLSGPELLPGCRVRVPFGRSKRIGIVIDTVERPAVSSDRLKSVEAVLDPQSLLDAELLASLRRAADYWCGAIGDVIFGALPLGLRNGGALDSFAEEIWRVTAAGGSARDARTRRGGSAALLETLADTTLSASELDTLLPGRRAPACCGGIDRTRRARGPRPVRARGRFAHIDGRAGRNTGHDPFRRRGLPSVPAARRHRQRQDRNLPATHGTRVAAGAPNVVAGAGNRPGATGL